MALHNAKQNSHLEVVCLVTTLNRGLKETAGHKLKESVIDRQAIQTGLPLLKMWLNQMPANNEYENELLSIYARLKSEGIDTVVYGDLFLQDIKTYREDLLQKAGMKSLFPLWQTDSRVLMTNFIESGFQAITCCIDTTVLEENCLGMELNKQFLDNLPEGVDPAGENGEFHTFCFDGPVFKQPVQYQTGTNYFETIGIKATHQSVRNTFAYMEII